MKRVLILSLQYYPQVGGAEVAIKEITDRIEPDDIEFHMITRRPHSRTPEEERIGNVILHRVGSGGGYLSKILYVPGAVMAARRLHRRHHFDGVWAMMSYMAFPAVLLELVGVHLPYILTLQDGDSAERVFGRAYIRPFLPLLSHGFRHAATVTALSTYLAEWARRMGYQGVVHVVPNGADTTRFANAKPCDVGKRAGETWLVTSSRLVHKNALDDVIRALAVLPPRVHFLVLGIGPDEAMLRALAKELGVTDRVHFGGFVPHAELPSHLAACDIFIRPSRTEGFGASFAEAMAAGLPVIATQEGGIADFLFDETRNPGTLPTGWAVDRDAPEQIARAVNDILARPEKAQEVVSNARELVRAKYDWNLIAHDMQALFNSLFAKKP